MTQDRPQAPVDATSEDSKQAPTQEQGQDNAENPQNPEQPDFDNMSYEEYLKLTNPQKTEAEIAQMIRKENRYTWLGRFQILAFVVIIVVIIALILGN